MSGSGGASFPRLGEQEWIALARRSIGGADIASLTSRTEDGIGIRPIYAASAAPVAARAPGAPWAIVERIDGIATGDLAGDVEAAIAGGADGVALVFDAAEEPQGRGLSRPADIASIAAMLGAAPAFVRIEAGEATPGLVQALVSGGAGPAHVVAAFDPLAQLAATGRLARPLAEHLDAIARLFRTMDDGGMAGEVAIADGRPWHDGGASDGEELAAVLAALAMLLQGLMERGVAPERAAARLGVTLAADADQFLTIAKMRAMRLLVARVLELSQVRRRLLPLHAETSWRMMSRRDPHVNMLRTTTAAFAAAVGGADSIAILPFDIGGDSFARRIARNAQVILKDESALPRFTDPGAGSGAIDALTGELAAAAWERFRNIAAEGGLLASLEAGSIQGAVEATRRERSRRVAMREMELIGTNVHCTVDDRADGAEPAPGRSGGHAAISVPSLVRERLAEPFERLAARAAALKRSGRPVTALLVSLGPTAETAEAIAYAADFFATGGIAAETADETGVPAPGRFAVACVCAGERSDVGAALAAAEPLRLAGVRLILVCGLAADAAIPQSIRPLPRSDTDIHAFLSEVLDTIAAATENGQD